MVQNVAQFRIFLSSPGDVREERDIARHLIDDVLPKGPFIRGRAAFDPISWDDPDASPGMPAHLTPQEAISRGLPKPSECDVVIVILWSRMGTALPKEFTKKDGSFFQSGTEWEFEDALAAAEASGAPTILLYRRTEEPKFGARDPKIHEKLEQLAKVDSFFESLNRHEGPINRSVTSYTTVGEFRTRLHQNLESIVSGFLGQGFSEELGVTKAAVTTMLGILKEQQVPPNQLEAKLKEIAERHLELTARLHALSKSNDEPEITGLREQAAEAIERGDYDQAAKILTEAVVIDRRAIDEQQEKLDRRRLSAAATIGQQGELERTRLNYLEAAEHFAEAASLLNTVDSDGRLDYLAKQALALYAQGTEFGDNPALVMAIDNYRLVLKEWTRERVPLNWARTQNNLGNALRALGRREAGTERLEQAVQSYKGALEEWPRESVPLDWARSQINLGETFIELGRGEAGTERQEQALAVFDAVLKECTSDRMQSYWANAQRGRALALQDIGRRVDGTGQLEQAADALRASLKEVTRERSPLEWARIQHDIGTTLRILGERERSPERLEQASAAYQNALLERERWRVPLEWARTQDELGTALRIQGELESSPNRLEQAIAAFEAALEELTREREPLRWAITQFNLGIVFLLLGRRERTTGRLELAVNAFQRALEVITREENPFDWAKAQNALGSAFLILGELTGQRAHFDAARDAVHKAANVYEDLGDQLQHKARYLERLEEIEAAAGRISPKD